MRTSNRFFAGPKVTGMNFIGRQEQLRILTSRVCDPQRTVSMGIAVIGVNRIGKSSLVQQFSDSKLKSPEYAVVPIDLSNISSPLGFWKTLARQLVRKAYGEAGAAELVSQIDAVSDSSSDWFDTYRDNILHTLLSDFTKNGRHPVLILDEFDYARELFKGNPAYLGEIISMAKETSFKVTIITMSRRTLPMIEDALTTSTSKLEGAFSKPNIYLGGFTRDEADTFMKKLWAGYEITPSEELVRALVRHAGRHPYLLNFYAHEMADLRLQGKEVTEQTPDEIKKQNQKDLKEYFESVYGRMQEDSRLNNMISAICGPVFVSEAEIDEMISEGYLDKRYYENQATYYFSLCEDYTDYLIFNAPGFREGVWETITEMEKKMGAFIAAAVPELTEIKEDNIFSGESQRTLMSLGINSETAGNIKDNLRKDRLNFGVNETVNEVLTLGQKIVIIKNNWPKFESLLQGGKTVWEAELDRLSKFRNPLYHSKPELLTKEQMALMLGICERIIRLPNPAT